MPIDYQVLEDGKLVLTVFSGHVTIQELVEHTRVFVNDARIQQGHRELVDLSPAETTDVSFENLTSAVDLEVGADRLRDARLAVFAPKDIHYGMSRMYVAIADQTPRSEVRIFRDEDLARSWLGLSPVTC